MPEGVLCCEKMKEQLVAFGDRTINVTTAKLKKSHCPFCQSAVHGHENARAARMAY
jgi:galactose-1-phosphate uridylyltransferase